VAPPLRYRDLHEAREQLSPAELRFERGRRTLGLFLGPALFALLLVVGPADPAARSLTAILGWVLSWWITEAVPIPVTALLGPALGVVLGVGSARVLFAPFADPIIYLFLGSFLIAEAMHGSGLDRRIARFVLSRPSVGASTTRVLFAFGLTCALLSMWLSNTATTAMLFPIALGVLEATARSLPPDSGGPVDPTRLRIGTALMLATAYASSVGGVATPVGSPPNLITLGLLAELGGVQVSFFQWMMVCAPLAILMSLIVVLYLRWALPPEIREIPKAATSTDSEAGATGWTPAERNVLFAFGLTVALWILPGVLALVLGTEDPLYLRVQELLPEGVVALLGASLLFVLPVSWRERRFTLSWNDATRIDWGTLLLFGGGLSLGGAMFRTGLARRLGEGMVRLTGARSLTAISYLFSATALLLTETTSNTAASTMVCPLAIAAARAAGVSPVPPAIATAIASSMAFLLPVSTPPNAIVYGSGCVPIGAMLRHGAVLDLIALGLGPVSTLLLCRAVGLA
jgi:sodium-dependent dicarboxylate transporter 2/3/5